MTSCRRGNEFPPPIPPCILVPELIYMFLLIEMNIEKQGNSIAGCRDYVKRVKTDIRRESPGLGTTGENKVIL